VEREASSRLAAAAQENWTKAKVMLTVGWKMELESLQYLDQSV